MTEQIHPTALVHPKAVIDPTAIIGPYAVIDSGVRIGPGCWVGPHVHLTGETTIGRENRFHAGCVIGDAPQDLKYKGEPTRVEIGDHNIFREHVTVHRSNHPEQPTRIGATNLFMAHSHVGHNSIVGNGVIIANGALLGGHVEVGDRAFISGNCLIHQFVRVGTLALMQGGAGIGKDLPPFTIARAVNVLCGLNVVGLRRAGLTSDQRLELKKAYRLLFRGTGNLKERLDAARAECTGVAAQTLIDFVATAKRGTCSDVSRAEETAEV